MQPLLYLLISPHVTSLWLRPLLLAYLLVLALLRGELLQHAIVSDSLQLLPQGALTRQWHGATSGGTVARSRSCSVGPPFKVHTGLADVAANSLPSYFLSDDSGAVLLVQRL